MISEAEEEGPTKWGMDADDADVTAYEPVFIDGAVAGFCTSGGYSHHTGTSVAYALVPRAALTDDLTVEIEILGQRRTARRITAPLFDADGVRLRG